MFWAILPILSVLGYTAHVLGDLGAIVLGMLEVQVPLLSSPSAQEVLLEQLEMVLSLLRLQLWRVRRTCRAAEVVYGKPRFMTVYAIGDPKFGTV